GRMGVCLPGGDFNPVLFWDNHFHGPGELQREALQEETHPGGQFPSQCLGPLCTATFQSGALTSTPTPMGMWFVAVPGTAMRDTAVRPGVDGVKQTTAERLLASASVIPPRKGLNGRKTKRVR